MASLCVESNTCLWIISPSFIIVFKMSVLTDASLYPRFGTEHGSLSITLHNFHLSDMRSLKIDAEILQHCVFRTQKRQRQHASVENEIGTSTVQCQTFPVLQCQTHSLRIGLVVIGYIIFFLHGICRMKIVASVFKEQSHFLSFVSLFNGNQGLLHLRRKVFFGIRHNAIITHFHDFLVRTCAHQQNEQRKIKNYSFHKWL